MSTRVLIIGTGLIGASFGLALRALEPAFEGLVLGWDTNAAELKKARELGAIDEALLSEEAALKPGLADVYVLATPVLPIMHWLERLAPVLTEGQFITDVGSTKSAMIQCAVPLYNGAGQAWFLPGHPMAGKESAGAALADAALFRGAAWLFTPIVRESAEHRPGASPVAPHEQQFRGWVQAIGARAHDLEAAQHDVLCAWVSHLPQMLSTALAALLEETFADDPEGRALVEAIGGRALRETTRLGASPYSMWRDIALTNTEPIAATLFALEQQLGYVRDNLRTPGLREAFAEANRFHRK